MIKSEIPLKIKQEIQRDIFNALEIQIEMTGSALARVLSRVSRNALAGIPGNDELETVLKAIYGQIGGINKLAGTLKLASMPKACDMDEKQHWKHIADLCRDVINRNDKLGGEQ